MGRGLCKNSQLPLSVRLRTLMYNTHFKFSYTKGFIWIGLSERQQEGTWMFTDGTTLYDGLAVFENGGSNENCAMLRFDVLDDHGCSWYLPFICMASGKCTYFQLVQKKTAVVGCSHKSILSIQFQLKVLSPWETFPLILTSTSY